MPGATSADVRYCHDALGQLTARRTAAACTSSPDETNTYDDAGNRTSAVAGGTTTNLAYTAAGVLCDLETGTAASCTGGNVAVDDAGRLSGYAGYTYQYDAQGRLTAACDDADCVGSGFRRIDFGYDGEGHRTAITATPASGAAVVTTFRYQGDAIVAEYQDGVLTREYTVDDAGTISKLSIPAGQTGAGTYLVTWNGHGDALALHRIETSGSLTLANSYTYSTWGLPTTATHNSIPDLGFRFLYVGAYDVQWDGTYGLPLIYMHARTYSPTLGRFLQPDPSRQDAQLFVYAANSPVSRVDPSGEVCVPFGVFALSCIPDAFVLIGSVAALGAWAVSTAYATYQYLQTHPITLSTTVTTNAERGAAWEDKSITKLRNSGKYPVIIPHKYFWTPWGGRYLDACAYSSWSHYYSRPNHPMACWEFKGSMQAMRDYFYSYQYDKDMWLMTTYRFPISVIGIRTLFP